jgi:hypothetical protein
MSLQGGAADGDSAHPSPQKEDADPAPAEIELDEPPAGEDDPAPREKPLLSHDTVLDTQAGLPLALPPYTAYRGSVVPVALARPSEIVEGLMEIVTSEGPILGYRLHAAYVQSSDGMRVGTQIAKSLNSAVSSAVRRGRLILEDPLREAGVRPATLRMPGQPPVLVRQLGPRRFEHIPPAELAEVMHAAGDEVGWEDELIFRATMHRYGLQRMGSAIRTRLQAVLPLAHELREGRAGR